MTLSETRGIRELGSGHRDSGRGVFSRCPAFCVLGLLSLLLMGCAALQQMGEVDRPQDSSPAEIRWSASFEEAAETARSENRPMMVVFYGVSSRRLDSGIFSDPDVIKLAQEFVCVKVGANQDALIQKYMVYEFPTIVFTDPQGGEYEKFVAPQAKRSFKGVLETATTPLEVEYSLSIDPSRPDQAHVRCVFRNVRWESLLLSLRERNNQILNVSYNSTDGIPRWEEVEESLWLMKFGTTAMKTATVEYEVGLNVISGLGTQMEYSSYVGNDYGILDGHALFLGPHNLHMIGRIDIHLDLPPGWHAITPWRESGGSHFTTDSMEEAVDSIFCIGRFQFARRQFKEHEICVVHLEDREIKPEYLEQKADRVVTIFEDYVTRFGDFPYEKYMAVFAQPASDGKIIHGSAHGTGFAGPLDAGYVFTAHEIFHVWNGGIANQNSDYEGWFKEGFTEYYGYLTPYRLGLYGKEQFLRYLNRNYEGYLEKYGTEDDIALTRVKEKLARDEWHEQMASAKIWNMYYKGSLVASLVDSEIKERTNGKKSIDDLMQYIFREFRDKRYTTEDILEALNKVAGQDFTQFFSDYVYGRKKLPAKAAKPEV